LPQRDTSKLLIYHKGRISHTIFSNIHNYIDLDDLAVFNDTRVVQGRLLFNKPTGAKIEVFCLEPVDPYLYDASFQRKESVVWNTLIGNAKKWKTGPLFRRIEHPVKDIILKAEKLSGSGATWQACISWEPGDYSFGTILEIAGSTPLPPYLKREPTPDDKYTYQTIYSSIDGSVAAPTAGFHFTDNILDEFRKRKMHTMNLTLHIGAGTFRPVVAEEVSQHPMHSEHIFFTLDNLNQLSGFQGNILAIGTTSTRTIESIYWLGCKIIRNPEITPENLTLKQWEDHDLIAVPKEKSIDAFIDYFEKYRIREIHTSTQLMIIPGYQFRIVNKMLTNFHQPKSTLLLLVSAFIGDDWKRIYRYAMDNEFRFLSYGDSSLLIP
ncbi:MAG: S-adenosylmethionine tRNA ribosyltransferase, partial [Bacteroides sp. SM23_62_1]